MFDSEFLTTLLIFFAIGGIPLLCYKFLLKYKWRTSLQLYAANAVLPAMLFFLFFRTAVGVGIMIDSEEEPASIFISNSDTAILTSFPTLENFSAFAVIYFFLHAGEFYLLGMKNTTRVFSFSIFFAALYCALFLISELALAIMTGYAA